MWKTDFKKFKGHGLLKQSIFPNLSSTNFTWSILEYFVPNIAEIIEKQGTIFTHHIYILLSFFLLVSLALKRNINNKVTCPIKFSLPKSRVKKNGGGEQYSTIFKPKLTWHLLLKTTSSWCFFFRILQDLFHLIMFITTFRVHPLSMYVKFTEKLTFLTPWYAYARVRTYLMDDTFS